MCNTSLPVIQALFKDHLSDTVEWTTVLTFSYGFVVINTWTPMDKLVSLCQWHDFRCHIAIWTCRHSSRVTYLTLPPHLSPVNRPNFIIPDVSSAPKNPEATYKPALLNSTYQQGTDYVEQTNLHKRPYLSLSDMHRTGRPVQCGPSMLYL